jgi:hypothetical protein
MAEDDNFFSRWSRRKVDARAGKPVEAEAPPAAEAAPLAVAADAPAQVEEQAPPPAPSIEEAQALTPQSDFKPFMQANVSPEVKNTALKKLWADPHFNVMDGMDTYIDDYSKPDPIPADMLRRMVGTKLLKIFDDEEEKKPVEAGGAAPTETVANEQAAESQAVAQSADSKDTAAASSEPAALPTAPTAALPTPEHDHLPDLRLQPNHAAEPAGSASSPGSGGA